MLDVLEEQLPIAPAWLAGTERAAWLAKHPGALSGLFSFVDAFSTRHKSSDDYRILAQRGLRRVYIGLETGDDALLAVLNKQNAADDVRQAVDIMKAGGVDVGVIVMLGIGGRRFAADHVQQTTAVLNAMALGGRDMIYFSPFVDFDGSAYGRLADEMGLEPMTRTEMDRQMAEIRCRPPLRRGVAGAPHGCVRYQGVHLLSPPGSQC